MKKLYMLLPAGLGRNRSLNPAASLRIESVYASPVLFSGVAAMALNIGELETIHIHLKEVLQNFIDFTRKHLNVMLILWLAIQVQLL